MCRARICWVARVDSEWNSLISEIECWTRSELAEAEKCFTWLTNAELSERRNAVSGRQNADATAKCRCGCKMQMRMIRRLDKTFSARVEMIWSEDIDRDEVKLISVSSSLTSARGVVWLRQCRLSFCEMMIVDWVITS
jgi:hypothetical protein